MVSTPADAFEAVSKRFDDSDVTSVYVKFRNNQRETIIRVRTHSGTYFEMHQDASGTQTWSELRLSQL